jgi:tight adherence protein B
MTLVGAAGAVFVGTLLGGVVVGAVAGAYGTVAARLLLRRQAERARTAYRAERLDLLAAAAAELRAGLPAGTALAGLAGAGVAGEGLVGAGGTGAGGTGDAVRARVLAAVVLAEQTGAPLAEVLERIEADARGTDRARAASAAQTAGSRATAWLLAGLPLAGIALGYAIGADPLAVLLHTPVGAACAFGAVTLQLAGLGWAGRITRDASAAVV